MPLNATILPGDSAPFFAARTAANPQYKFDTTAGRYVIISFLGSASHPVIAAAAEHIRVQHRGRLDDHNVCFFAVSSDPKDERDGHLADAIPGIRTFWDFDLAVSRLYGRVAPGDKPDSQRYAPVTLVLDPMLRVIAAVPVDDKHNARIDRILAGLPVPARHAGVEMTAPVLIVPRVFEPGFCAQLIALHQDDGGTPTGFMRDVDGKTVQIFDDGRKRRRDLIVEDDAVQTQIRARLERRLVPPIERAFQFNPTYIERYLIARYDAADQGFFMRHRDNTTKGTAHRRFAVTINLNTEDYEGGDLVFPEFGPRPYRAPTGGAVVFSCSLMHEALPVTRGKRYAFLPFLYDAAAAAIREQNLPFLAENAPPAAPKG